MRRWLAVGVGAVAGIVLAGVIAPPLMMLLPGQLRGPALLWLTSAVVVTAAILTAWCLSSSRAV